MPTSDNLLVSPFWINAGWAELRNQVGECSIFHSRATIEAAVSRQDRMHEQDRHVLVYALAVARGEEDSIVVKHREKPGWHHLHPGVSVLRVKRSHMWTRVIVACPINPLIEAASFSFVSSSMYNSGLRHRHALNLHRVTIYRQGRRTLRRNKKALDCPNPGFQWCAGVMQCLCRCW